jgi:hypothetical protein
MQGVTHSMPPRGLSSRRRIEELEAATGAALVVNRHLNGEVESYVRALDAAERDRDAWRAHAARLARRLLQQRRQDAGADGGGEEALLRLLREEERAEAEEDGAGGDAARAVSHASASSSSPSPGAPPGFEPTDGQLKAMAALVAKGRATGWIIDPAEVGRGWGGGVGWGRLGRACPSSPGRERPAHSPARPSCEQPAQLSCGALEAAARVASFAKWDP